MHTARGFKHNCDYRSTKQFILLLRLLFNLQWLVKTKKTEVLESEKKKSKKKSDFFAKKKKKLKRLNRSKDDWSNNVIQLFHINRLVF